MKCPQASDIGDLTKQIQDLMDGSLPDEGWGADCLVLCESVNFLSEIANRGDLHNQFPSNKWRLLKATNKRLSKATEYIYL